MCLRLEALGAVLQRLLQLLLQQHGALLPGLAVVGSMAQPPRLLRRRWRQLHGLFDLDFLLRPRCRLLLNFDLTLNSPPRVCWSRAQFHDGANAATFTYSSTFWKSPRVHTCEGIEAMAYRRRKPPSTAQHRLGRRPGRRQLHGAPGRRQRTCRSYRLLLLGRQLLMLFGRLDGTCSVAWRLQLQLQLLTSAAARRSRGVQAARSAAARLPRSSWLAAGYAAAAASAAASGGEGLHGRARRQQHLAAQRQRRGRSEVSSRRQGSAAVWRIRGAATAGAGCCHCGCCWPLLRSPS